MSRELPLIAKKSLGQNFLNNSGIPRKMADAAAITKEDTVLEIGPGTGALTEELLRRAKTVIAIETDPRSIEVLKERYAQQLDEGTLKIVSADIREVDLAALGLAPGGYTVVANIPYYLSGFLFRMFLEHALQPKTIVFLVQKEVAERITRDKKESLLSLSVKAYGTPRYVATVKRGNFTPQPKVDSAIIAIADISKRNFARVREDAFFEILHEGFKSRRKQLIGNLSDTYRREDLAHIFASLDLALTVRGEDVPLEIWLKIAEACAETHTSP
jgi:16S rRNA (adenine1518-N6/adenine1519-N6)-dimethyltransferase